MNPETDPRQDDIDLGAGEEITPLPPEPPSQESDLKLSQTMLGNDHD